jgi:hypothetical protein
VLGSDALSLGMAKLTFICVSCVWGGGGGGGSKHVLGVVVPEGGSIRLKVWKPMHFRLSIAVLTFICGVGHPGVVAKGTGSKHSLGVMVQGGGKVCSAD